MSSAVRSSKIQRRHSEAPRSPQRGEESHSQFSKLQDPLPREFYDRDPRIVSRELLGKVLVRREKKKLLAARVVEVEAYLGSDDPASHSFSGRTARNAVLFGPPGFAYIYFIYGNHYCLNVSCLPDGTAGGVLFRALEPLVGIDQMARARGISINRAAAEDHNPHVGRRSVLSREAAQEYSPPRKRWVTRQTNPSPGGAKETTLRLLTSGPGRLAEAFGITRERDNAKDLTGPSSDLFIADDGFPAPRILATPRIGITKAADLPLRYLIEGNPFVSGPRKFLRAS